MRQALEWPPLALEHVKDLEYHYVLPKAERKTMCDIYIVVEDLGIRCKGGQKLHNHQHTA